MKIIKFFRENLCIIILSFITLAHLAVAARINLFRYNNFDFGKFDLGNMSQMLWNTLNGRFMYLTDYFGTNLPRWAMSHVDPVLLLFLPLFAFIPHPLVLVFSQFILVTLSGFIIYKIAVLELKSKTAALLISSSFLFYPALGYLNATTGYHGVTVVIPFFLLSFYIFERMYKKQDFSKRNIILLWIMLVLTMAGKEQIPLYTMIFGFYILFFRTHKNYDKLLSNEGLKAFFSQAASKIGLSIILVSFAWFITAFFIIIPLNARYRIEGYQKFADSLSINPDSARDVDQDNYFLSRYEEFGTSYSEIMLNMVLNHKKTIKVFFGGDKLDNLRRTFEPVGYLPLLSPFTLIIAAPDFIINYMTTAGGIGTAEITNHRVSMIIPVLYISIIYGLSFLLNYLSNWKRLHAVKKIFLYLLPAAALFLSIHTSFTYNNPIYLWIDQAVRKRVFARMVDGDVNLENIKVGDVVKLTQLDNKDVECAEKIVGIIPNQASVSGPDYLGAHLSLRETYAIFPALYNEADYVIVDVFSRKILTILDIQSDLVRDVVNNIIRDENYELLTGCGNLFVFKNVGAHTKNVLLPLQERFEYPEKYSYEILFGLTVVDFKIPAEVTRGVNEKAQIVYVKKDSTEFDGYVMYTTYINNDTGELYQLANLPSFSIMEPRNWVEQKYHIEDIDVALPTFIDPGTYKVFVGMSNKVKTRNLYLGDIVVK